MKSRFKEGTTTQTLIDEHTRWLKALGDAETNGLTADNSFGKLRFGQHFLNTYLNPDDYWPGIYFSNDTDQVFASLYQHLRDTARVDA